MDVIADILLIAATLGAGIYCLVLARRLSRFTDLENGMGGAIAVLSTKVDEMTKALRDAQTLAEGSSDALTDLTERADGVAQRLELMVAALHDVPEVQATDEPVMPETPPASADTSQMQTEGSRQGTATLFRSSRNTFLEAAE